MNEPIEINRSAIYQMPAAASLCRLSKATLSRAINKGELNATKRSEQTFIEGEALFAWLTGREQASSGLSCLGPENG